MQKMNQFNEFPILNKLPSDLKLNINFYCVFGATGNELLFVTNDDKVYAMGDNKEGCLGVEVSDRIDLKIQLKLKPTIIPELCDKHIIYITNGLHNVIALSLNGDIYIWGQFGNEKPISNRTPNKFELNCKKITRISCGFYHVLILTDCGAVYSIAKIDEALHNSQLIPVNTDTFVNNPIVAIDCGDFYSLLLDKKGCLYSWSCKALEKIDIENSDSQIIPTPIHNLTDFRVQKMTCGAKQCLVLTTDQRVYSIKNKEIQFNSNENDHKINLVEVVINITSQENKLKFVDIAASIYCDIYAILSADSEYYIWGMCGNEYIESPQECKVNSFHEIFSTFAENKITYSPVYVTNNTYQTSYSIDESTEYLCNDLINDHKLLIEKRHRDNEMFRSFMWSASSKMANLGPQRFSIFDSLFYFMQTDCGVVVDDEDIFEPNCYEDYDALSEILQKCCNDYFNFNDYYIQSGRYGHEFEEIELKGCGGFGSVYKALSKFDGKHYAIKKIQIEDAILCDNTLKELKVWANMSSEYVVQYNSAWIELNEAQNSETLMPVRDPSIERSFSISQESKASNATLMANNATVFIQMELCCTTLSQLVPKINTELKCYRDVNFKSQFSPVGYFIACELFLEIVECVQYLHSRDQPVIHRDLKPTNILITDGSNGRFVKIADFGLATNHLFDEQSHSIALGTQQYMAPEVKNSRRYNTKADMYSLGIILKELLNIDPENNSLVSEPSLNSSILRSKYISAVLMYQNLVSSLPSRRHTCEQIIRSKSVWSMSFIELINDESFSRYQKYFYSDSKEYRNLFCSKFLRHRFFIQKPHQSLVVAQQKPTENKTSVETLGEVDASNYLIEVLETIRKEQSIKIQDDFSGEKIEYVYDERKKGHNISLIIDKGAKLEGISNAITNNIKASIDFKPVKFEISGDITLPELKIAGIYKLDGKLFKFLPLKGNGNISLQLENLTGSFCVKGSVKENKFTTDIVDIKMSIASVDLFLENLIDANISPFLNSVINFLAKPLIDKLILENSREMERINNRIKKAFDKKLRGLNVEGLMNLIQ